MRPSHGASRTDSGNAPAAAPATASAAPSIPRCRRASPSPLLSGVALAKPDAGEGGGRLGRPPGEGSLGDLQDVTRACALRSVTFVQAIEARGRILVLTHMSLQNSHRFCIGLGRQKVMCIQKPRASALQEGPISHPEMKPALARPARVTRGRNRSPLCARRPKLKRPTPAASKSQLFVRKELCPRRLHLPCTFLRSWPPSCCFPPRSRLAGYPGRS